jgi:hypothetical protein
MPPGPPRRRLASGPAGACAALLLALLSACAALPGGVGDGDIVEIDGQRFRIERVARGDVPLREVAPGWLSHPQRGLLALHADTPTAYLVRIALPGQLAPTDAAAASTAPRPADEAVLATAGRLVEVDTALPREGEWREQFALRAEPGGGVSLVAPGPRKTLGPPVWWSRDAAGRWSPQSPRFPQQPYDYGGVALGDFDADGRVDLALAMHLLGFAAVLADPSGNWREGSDGLPHSRRKGAVGGSGVAAATVADAGGDRLLLLPEADGRGSRFPSEFGLAEFRLRDGRWRATALAPGLVGTGLRLALAPGCPLLLGVRSSGSNQIPLFRHDGKRWRAVGAPAVTEPVWMVNDLQLGQFDGRGCADLLVARWQPGERGWHNALSLWLDSTKGWQRHDLPRLPSATAHSALWAERRGGELQVLVGSQDGSLDYLRGEPAGLRWVGHLPAPAWRRGCRVVHLAALPGREGRWVAAFAGEAERFDTRRCQGNGGLVELAWVPAADG